MTDTSPPPDDRMPPPGPTPPVDERQLDESGNSLWTRLLYMILFGVLMGYVVIALYLGLSLLQFVVFVVVGKPNDELRGFMRRLLHYIGAILAFLAFISDTKPFPFSNFPDGSPKQSS